MELTRRLRTWWRIVALSYLAIFVSVVTVIALGYSGMWIALAAIVFGGIACGATVRMLTYQSRKGAVPLEPVPAPASDTLAPTFWK